MIYLEKHTQNIAGMIVLINPHVLMHLLLRLAFFADYNSRPGSVRSRRMTPNAKVMLAEWANIVASAWPPRYRLCQGLTY